MNDAAFETYDCFGHDAEVSRVAWAAQGFQDIEKNARAFNDGRLL